MHVEISNSGAFGSALVSLDPGEEFVSEAGAMFRASSNVDIDVTTRSRSTGGIMSGLRRILAQENLFFSRYSVTTNRVAEVGLAPTLQGQIALIECAGDTRWVCAGGSYLGSAADLNIDTKFQGLRGMLSGESLSFITVEGIGALLVNAFGLISGVDVDGGLTVDTGHVVAFEETLDYTVSKAGGSWISSFLTSEGLVLNFSGQGRVYVQSHNPDEFGKSLGPLLPLRDS
jgi:uncharacterized protein (TIGR00266 family)